MRTRLVAAVAIAWVGACRSAPPPPPVARAAPEPRASAPSAPAFAVPSLEPGPPGATSALSSDALWSAAAAGDPIDLQRLADREGAIGLLDGFDAGGTIALTALAALPYADDAELALGRLCDVLAHGEPVRLAPVIVAVQAIAGQPPLPTEQLDPRGAERCRPALDALARSDALAPHERDLAASARVMIDEQLDAH